MRYMHVQHWLRQWQCIAFVRQAYTEEITRTSQIMLYLRSSSSKQLSTQRSESEPKYVPSSFKRTWAPTNLKQGTYSIQYLTLGACAQGIIIVVCLCVCGCVSVCVYVPCLPAALDTFTANYIWQSEGFKDCKLQNCLKTSVSGDTASFVKFSATSAILFACGPIYIAKAILHKLPILLMPRGAA